jgi:mono/diheme cytochrome c family protein
MKRLTAVAACLLVLGPGVARAAQDQDRAALDRGREVYKQQRCQTCHAIDGVGNRRYPLDGVGARLTEEQIRQWIVAPREMDPKVRKRAYDKLPKEDLDALVAYMRSLETPKKPR